MFLHGRLGRPFSRMDVDRERSPPGHLHILCAAFFQVLEEAFDVRGLTQGLQRSEDAHGERQYGSHAHNPNHHRQSQLAKRVDIHSSSVYIIIRVGKQATCGDWFPTCGCPTDVGVARDIARMGRATHTRKEMLPLLIQACASLLERRISFISTRAFSGRAACPVRWPRGLLSTSG